MIEAALRPSFAVLENFYKKKRKWFYFKDRFLNLEESDKHTDRGFSSGMHENFAKKAFHVLIEKTLPKMLFWNNETYIIYSDNIGTRKTEYIITCYIESDTGSIVSSSFAGTYVIPAKCWGTLSPDKNVSSRHCQQTDFLEQNLDLWNSYNKTLKPDIFFAGCVNSGCCEELLLIEVKIIPSINDHDVQQLINYTLPTISKQGNAKEFLTANNPTLVKLQEQMIENKPVIVIWRRKIPMWFLVNSGFEQVRRWNPK